MKSKLFFVLAAGLALVVAPKGFAETCTSGVSSNITYALIPSSNGASGYGNLGTSTNNNPILSTDNLLVTSIPYPAVPVTLNSSNGTNYCNSYYSGGSWVTDNNFAGTGVSVVNLAAFLLDTSGGAATRIPGPALSTGGSQPALPAAGFAFNTVVQEFNNYTSDPQDTQTCVDGDSPPSYYWKVVLCNN